MKIFDTTSCIIEYFPDIIHNKLHYFNLNELHFLNPDNVVYEYKYVLIWPLEGNALLEQR